MIYWRNNRISEKQKQALILIYKYRGLTNEQLRELIFGHLNSKQEGQKANISRYISGLRKMKMITSESCYPYSKELFHYLTNKGVEFVKENLPIDPEHNNAGFKDNPDGDFDAVMLKPGLKNMEHTMMYLDFAIKFRDKLDIRHNLYSVKEFVYYVETITSLSGRKGKIRPDGEILLKNNHVFCLEIDTGSERYEQLVAKFENYKRYLDYCIENDINRDWKGILFVCKESKLEFSKDKRLHTILRAAVEGLKHYCWTFGIQIFRGDSFSLQELLKKNAELLSQFEIPIPSKENPVQMEKQRREEEKQRREEERRRSQEEAQRVMEENLRKKELEQQKRMRLAEEQRRREMEEEERKNKRLFGMGKFFS